MKQWRDGRLGIYLHTFHDLLARRAGELGGAGSLTDDRIGATGPIARIASATVYSGSRHAGNPGVVGGGSLHERDIFCGQRILRAVLDTGGSAIRDLDAVVDHSSDFHHA